MPIQRGRGGKKSGRRNVEKGVELRREVERSGNEKKTQTVQERETKRGDATVTRDERKMECTIRVA